MGEAKRRKAEIAGQKILHDIWRASLSSDEQTISKVAERLDERLIRGMNFIGGCYHLAFFMTRYFASQGILVKPVVGWVNDGQWDGMTSHAWIEYEGKRTDISLNRSEYPEFQPPGATIVLDHFIRPGVVEYSYFIHGDSIVEMALAKMRTSGNYDDVLPYKEAEHQRMLQIAVSDNEMDAYLRMAPRNTNFEALSALIA